MIQDGLHLLDVLLGQAALGLLQERHHPCTEVVLLVPHPAVPRVANELNLGRHGLSKVAVVPDTKCPCIGLGDALQLASGVSNVVKHSTVNVQRLPDVHGGRADEDEVVAQVRAYPLSYHGC